MIYSDEPTLVKGMIIEVANRGFAFIDDDVRKIFAGLTSHSRSGTGHEKEFLVWEYYVLGVLVIVSFRAENVKRK